MKTRITDLAPAPVHPVQMYSHPLSTHAFTSETEAQADYQKCLKQKAEAEKAERLRASLSADADYVRLNAKSLADIPVLMTKICKKHKITLKIDSLTLSFGPVYTSHGAPIGKSTTWGSGGSLPGWRGRISGLLKGGKTWSGSDMGISDLCGSDLVGSTLFIRGLHTGTGSSGQDFGIDFYFFLEDFPHLLALYKKREKYDEARAKYANQCQKIMDETFAVVDAAQPTKEKRAVISSLFQRLKKEQAVWEATRAEIDALETAITKEKARCVRAVTPPMQEVATETEIALFNEVFTAPDGRIPTE